MQYDYQRPAPIHNSRQKAVYLQVEKFLEVSEGFEEGAKVRFYDPRTPDDHRESVILADGLRYDGGIPFIWTEDSDADSFMECNTFAVYWRPVEEMSEK